MNETAPGRMTERRCVVCDRLTGAAWVASVIPNGATVYRCGWPRDCWRKKHEAPASAEARDTLQPVQIEVGEA